MARVSTTDDVWADFRASVGLTSISEVLGELVERHVERYRAQRVRDGRADDREVLDALDDARELHADLAAIVERLERRVARDVSWERDVYE